jgi:hypothetical protein
MHRLSSTEYNATVQDVLGTALQPASGAWRSEELAGFDNIASVLGIDERQYDRYFRAAQALAVETMADAKARGRFVACSLAELGCVRASVAAAGLRIFRRPLEEAELEIYQRVYETARELGDDADSAFTLSLQALLSSAQFVYRIELDPQPDSVEPHPLGAYELASRLSYLLWSSAPDDELLQVAEGGMLADPGELSATVQRMLDDPKSDRFVTSFAGQWLGARQVVSHAALPKFYQWTPRVAKAASREMLLYFEDFLRHERSWFEFPTADFNYVDGELAGIYGIPTDLTGIGHFERVEHQADARRGFLGLLGFLALSSFDRRTSPSKRGRFIAGNLLCSEPPAPPPGVPELDADEPGDQPQTLDVRARLEAHRREPRCAACHALFDPYGLALEEYDAIGLYRSTYEDGTPIDASVKGANAGEPSFEGLAGLATTLAADPRLGRCLAQKLLTYALGRAVGAADAPLIERIERTWLTPGEVPTVRRLLQVLVASDAFRLRSGGN